MEHKKWCIFESYIKIIEIFTITNIIASNWGVIVLVSNHKISEAEYTKAEKICMSLPTFGLDQWTSTRKQMIETAWYGIPGAVTPWVYSQYVRYIMISNVFLMVHKNHTRRYHYWMSQYRKWCDFEMKVYRSRSHVAGNPGYWIKSVALTL